jgi:hypothetical protein
MGRRELESRLRNVEKHLRMANSQDPKWELDDEGILRYEKELERLERALDKLDDYEQDEL